MNSIRNHMAECGMQAQDEVFEEACFSGSPQVSDLHELFPDLPSDDIEKALKDCGGNIEAAVSTLLDNAEGKLSEDELPTYVADSSSDSESEIWNLPLATAIHLQSNLKEGKKTVIEEYRDATIVGESAVFRVHVNRMSSDFANDILGIYKNQCSKFCSRFGVKFENETSVGSGPVREFFSLVMKMLIDGFPLDGEDKPPTLVFEGENDHKIPVANSLLRSTGFYKSIGRMIAHSFLHAGPPVFGISKVVVDYLVCDTDEIPLIEVADIPDIDLRIALNELNSLGKGEAPGIALKDVLTQYRDEASILDTSLSGANRHVIAQQIMLHSVITRRKSELQDLADGMNEFGLVDFLKKHKDFVHPFLFPRSAASIINKDDLKKIIELEEENPDGDQLMLFLKQYIDLIDGATNGPNLKDLLSFWTGCDLLPAAGAILHLNVDKTKDRNLLPESRTCFYLLVLPCYENFDELKAKLDKALQFGSRGFTNV